MGGRYRKTVSGCAGDISFDLITESRTIFLWHVSEIKVQNQGDLLGVFVLRLQYHKRDVRAGHLEE